jgi:hypothetical protein
MNKQRYHYQRADDPSSQIRLVSITSSSPRQDQKRIHLKLELVAINKVEGRDRYEAEAYRICGDHHHYHLSAIS